MSHSRFQAFALLLLIWSLITIPSNAQVGTETQAITAQSGFANQKLCARNCFVRTGFCPSDVLGQSIGCTTATDCRDSGYQATNDCYCRSDLQGPAQDFLTSCVLDYCTVGNSALDASTAGNLYSQYCQQKGYSAVPATVDAKTTGAGGSVIKATATGLGPLPTASSTSEGTGTSTGSKSGPSITEIIGIVVGSLAGLAFLAVILKIALKHFRCWGRRKAGYQHQMPFVNTHPDPSWPMQNFHEPYYPKPGTEVDVSPDDSISMVSGIPRPAPTLVSAAPGYGPRY